MGFLTWCFVCPEAFSRCVVDVEIGTTPLAVSGPLACPRNRGSTTSSATAASPSATSRRPSARAAARPTANTPPLRPPLRRCGKRVGGCEEGDWAEIKHRGSRLPATAHRQPAVPQADGLARWARVGGSDPHEAQPTVLSALSLSRGPCVRSGESSPVRWAGTRSAGDVGRRRRRSCAILHARLLIARVRAASVVLGDAHSRVQASVGSWRRRESPCFSRGRQVESCAPCGTNARP